MKLSILAVLVAVVLSACGRSDTASFLIDGADLSLTLVRNQSYAWSDEWDLELVTTHQPDCMRRNPLKPAPDAGFKLEVFRALEGGYILKQGNNWYITETGKCQLQQFKTPPAEPGDPLGAFTIKEQRLQFVAVPKPPAAAQATPVQGTQENPASAAPVAK